jgi:hypothetical protein
MNRAPNNHSRIDVCMYVCMYVCMWFAIAVDLIITGPCEAESQEVLCPLRKTRARAQRPPQRHLSKIASGSRTPYRRTSDRQRWFSSPQFPQPANQKPISDRMRCMRADYLYCTAVRGCQCVPQLPLLQPQFGCPLWHWVRLSRCSAARHRRYQPLT